jgi:hypothetical protein
MLTKKQNQSSKKPLTYGDLQEFKNNLIIELKEFINPNPEPKKWVRSLEVRNVLKISPGTLQKLRINGTLNFNQIGGIIYYKYEDIQKLLEK